MTGGGTGGHAYPAISIAEALRAEYPDCQLLYLGSKDGPEARLAADAGIPFHGLTSRRLRKAISLEGIKTGFSLIRGLCEAFAELHKFQPDLVIGTGGYAAAAVVAAQSLRLGKTLIHEQNVVPGRTNLWLSRFASRVCVSFEDTLRYFPPEKTVLTGLPIRSNLMDLPDKTSARMDLGLDPELFTVLVLGGSQGAKRLNEIVARAIPGLCKFPVQVMHQVGRRNLPEAENARKSMNCERYHMRAYYDDMRPVYASADLVVSRSGASTIAELTMAGLPAIFIPYPHAYADHQKYNGQYVERNGGGVVVDESEFDADLFISMAEKLLSAPDLVDKMASESRKLGRPNAARDIVRIVAEMI